MTMFNYDLIRFSDLIDFSNLNVPRPFPQTSAGGGEESFRTHKKDKSHCASENGSSLPTRGFLRGRRTCKFEKSIKSEKSN